MARWTIVYTDGMISKDGVAYSGLDLSFLPSDVLNVQSYDGVTCDIEHGVRATETNTHNTEDAAVSTLSWWSNVESAWQAAYDAEQAAIAAAAAAEAAASESTPA